MEENEIEIDLSDKYLPFMEVLDGQHPQVDTIIVTGGRDSGKSFGVSLIACEAASTYNHRILYTRYTLKSAEDSIIPDFTEKIDLLGYGSVSSLDTLSFDHLSITSRDSPSDIILVVNGTKLSISSNNVSNFDLSGYLEELDVGFYYGDGILYAHDLNTRQINIDHRGTNSMHLHPGESLTGTMQGAGNTIIYYKPLERDVNIIGTGKLIERY